MGICFDPLHAWQVFTNKPVSTKYSEANAIYVMIEKEHYTAVHAGEGFNS